MAKITTLRQLFFSMACYWYSISFIVEVCLVPLCFQVRHGLPCLGTPEKFTGRFSFTTKSESEPDRLSTPEAGAAPNRSVPSLH